MPQCWAQQRRRFLSPLNGNQKPGRRDEYCYYGSKKPTPRGAVMKMAKRKTVKPSTVQAMFLYSALLGDVSLQRGPASYVFLNLHSPLSLLQKGAAKESALSLHWQTSSTVSEIPQNTRPVFSFSIWGPFFCVPRRGVHGSTDCCWRTNQVTMLPWMPD